MRRVLKNIEYRHEGDRSQVTIHVEMQGASSTDLIVESTTIGDTTTVQFWTDSSGDGIAALADNEGISQTEALGAVAGLLSDLTKAETLNRRARSGLAEHVLTKMAEGRD